MQFLQRGANSTWLTDNYAKGGEGAGGGGGAKGPYLLGEGVDISLVALSAVPLDLVVDALLVFCRVTLVLPLDLVQMLPAVDFFEVF